MQARTCAGQHRQALGQKAAVHEHIVRTRKCVYSYVKNTHDTLNLGRKSTVFMNLNDKSFSLKVAVSLQNASHPPPRFALMQSSLALFLPSRDGWSNKSLLSCTMQVT